VAPEYPDLMRNRGPVLGALAAFTILLALTAIVARGVDPGMPAPVRSTVIRANPNIGPFRGMGTWVDIYDDPSWAHPRRAVQGMAAQGVRTLYLETSNYSRNHAFVFKDGVTKFVDAAHAFGVQIVSWYLPGLRRVATDFRRARAAIRFVTPNGNAFDGFGLDIEASVVTDPASRTARLLRLSNLLRNAAGPTYPLGAIIPSPRRIDVTDPHYWPGFPYAQLAATYDAILPMTYYTYRVSGGAEAHWYVSSVIDLIRRDVGNDQVPIHVIGGIANASSGAETRGFVHAVREHGVIGASFYTYPTIDPSAWSELRNIPADPVGTPALPVRPGPAALGNITGGDQTHPKEVVYRTAGKAGSWSLSFEGFDAQSDEVSVYVNWRPLGSVAPTTNWGPVQTLDVPPSWLHNSSPNYLSFVASGDDPAWSTWGVRGVDLAKIHPSPSPTPSPTST
jgi:hypothetical protein